MWWAGGREVAWARDHDRAHGSVRVPVGETAADGRDAVLLFFDASLHFLIWIADIFSPTFQHFKPLLKIIEIK